MNKIENSIAGKTFGRWFVLDEMKMNQYGHQMWLCECECGTERYVNRYKLEHGLSKSCGCLAIEEVKKRSSTHKMSKDFLFSEWQHMKSRCRNDAECKNRYSERGISVCEEWKDSFETFYQCVSKLPHYGEKGRSLDRIDNNKGYSPDNVRWATVKEQARNRENNVCLTVDGETKCLAEWLESPDTIDCYGTVWGRLKRGWSAKRALFEPCHTQHRRGGTK